jgi:hypothetical protein
MEISHDEKVKRFGYDPDMGLDYLGIVRTAKIVFEDVRPLDYQDWEIYFNPTSRLIDVCFAGCNGTYFHGRENEDGSTTLHPELDKVFRLLRNGEYVHPDQSKKLLEDAVPVAPDATEVATRVIGLPEEKAVEDIQSAGFTSRIVSIDGVGQPVTMDCRTNRINLSIEDGIVTEADVG